MNGTINPTRGTPLWNADLIPLNIVRSTVPRLVNRIGTNTNTLRLLRRPRALLMITGTALRLTIRTTLTNITRKNISRVVNRNGNLNRVLVRPRHPNGNTNSLHRLRHINGTNTVIVSLKNRGRLNLILRPTRKLTIRRSVPVPLVNNAMKTRHLLPFATATLNHRHYVKKRGTLFSIFPTDFLVFHRNCPSWAIVLLYCARGGSGALLGF